MTRWAFSRTRLSLQSREADGLDGMEMRLTRIVKKMNVLERENFDARLSIAQECALYQSPPRGVRAATREVTDANDLLLNARQSAGEI